MSAEAVASGHLVLEVVNPQGVRHRIAEWITSQESGEFELCTERRLSLDALADSDGLAASFLCSLRKAEENPYDGRNHGTTEVSEGPVPRDAAGLAENGAGQALLPTLAALVERAMAADGDEDRA